MCNSSKCSCLLDRCFRTDLQREFVVFHAEDVLSQVEMWQLTHCGKQGDVTALHSEHRTVTNSAAQVGSTDQCPGVRIRPRSTLLVIPDHCTLVVCHEHTWCQQFQNKFT